MAGEWPQEIGQDCGKESLTLGKGEGFRLGGPDEAGEHQPELTPDREESKRREMIAVSGSQVSLIKGDEKLLLIFFFEMEGKKRIGNTRTQLFSKSSVVSDRIREV